jgi:hypothetical protein
MRSIDRFLAVVILLIASACTDSRATSAGKVSISDGLHLAQALLPGDDVVTFMAAEVANLEDHDVTVVGVRPHHLEGAGELVGSLLAPSHSGDPVNSLEFPPHVSDAQRIPGAVLPRNGRLGTSTSRILYLGLHLTGERVSLNTLDLLLSNGSTVVVQISIAACRDKPSAPVDCRS